MKIQTGPILKFCGATTDTWTISFLVVTDFGQAPELHYRDGGSPTTVTLPLLYNSQKSWLWSARVTFPRSATTKEITYSIRTSVQEVAAEFHVPAAGTMPAMAYGSCAGFHSVNDARKYSGIKNERWFHLLRQHHHFVELAKSPESSARETEENPPYHLLLMGGDQVYADSIWEDRGETSKINEWVEKGQKTSAKFSSLMNNQVERYYMRLYLQRWSERGPADVYARIPSLMMWDDHDIFDGWGSLEQSLHECPVYQGIFRTAAQYFRLFQQHSNTLQEIPGLISQLVPGEASRTAASNDQHHDDQHHSVAFHSDKWAIAALDLRGSRTRTQIVGRRNLDRFLAWLDQLSARNNSPRHLILMLSIPLAYPSFHMAESFTEHIFNYDGLNDDLRDHWNSGPHREEQVRLIKRLLSFSRTAKCRVTVVSGDVHVATKGAILENQPSEAAEFNKITQLVSSGIVNTPPGRLFTSYLNQLAGRQMDYTFGVTGQMTTFTGTSELFIARRNWLSLQPDSKDRIWVRLHVEGQSDSLSTVIDYPLLQTQT